MPRMSRRLMTVLFSLVLLPGACLAQQTPTYGTVVPGRSVVPNGPIGVSGWANPGNAPRGPKTITFSPQTNAARITTASGSQTVNTASRSSRNGFAELSGTSPPFGAISDEDAAVALSTEPTSPWTDPMLQNMSNPGNLSTTGMSSGQYTAPNSYFGRQHAEWSNRHELSLMPGAFGELSRTVTQSSGTQFSPNTYFGGGYSNWSNLSSGMATPSPLGSWSYSIR